MWGFFVCVHAAGWDVVRRIWEVCSRGDLDMRGALPLQVHMVVPKLAVLRGSFLAVAGGRGVRTQVTGVTVPVGAGAGLVPVWQPGQG